MRKSVVIFGPGCARCLELTRRVEEAAHDLGIECEIVKMSNIHSFANFGVSMTPALMVDDVLKVQGRVPTVEDLKEMLAPAGQTAG
jgi:small redox-active disulfide protein 2